MLRTEAIPELLEEAEETEAESSSHRVKAWVLRLRRKLEIESVKENVIIRTRHGYCWNPDIPLITDWEQVTQEIKNNPEQAEPDCTEKFMPGCQARFAEQRREVLRTMMDCDSYRQVFGDGILKWSCETMNFLTISFENYRPVQGREAAAQFEKIMQEVKPVNSTLYKLAGGQYLLILPDGLDPSALLNLISQRFSDFC